jgi:hypothetical protein
VLKCTGSRNISTRTVPGAVEKFVTRVWLARRRFAWRLEPHPRLENCDFRTQDRQLGVVWGAASPCCWGFRESASYFDDGWGCWTSLLTPSMQYFQPGPSSFTTRDIVYYAALNALDKILFHNKICRFITIVLVAITSFTIH